MMRRVTALALHMLRATVRSRVVAALLLMLAAVALLLPHSLKGDGTPAGDARMLLTWTLGVTVVLLAAATLWAGCGAVAADIADGALGGIVVTPVRAWELWLGKWLGLVALNGILLAAVLGIVALQLAVRGAPHATLRPRRLLLPSPASLDEQAAQMLAQARRAGAVAPDAQDAALLREIRDYLQRDHVTVNPGESLRWTFAWPPRARRAGGELVARLELLSPFGGLAGIEGRCRVLDLAGRELAATAIAAEDGRHVQLAFASDDIGTSPGLALVLENQGPPEGMAVLVHAARGAVLLAPGGSFTGNLVVVGLVLWSVLAALAAVGLTAGACFSLPVAVFVASAVAVIGLLGHATIEDDAGCGDAHHHAAAETHEALSTSLAVATLRALAVVTQPVVDAAPLDRLGDGIRVEPAAAGRAWLRVGGALPLVFLLAGAAVLRWREYP